MRELVVVLTCPARPQYLGATLASLDAEGALSRERLVYSDGIGETMPGIPYGWQPAAGARTEGDKVAMWRALTLALARDPDVVLYAEDDVLAAPGAVDLAFAMGVPDHLAMVSLFDRHEFEPSPYLKAGLYEVPLAGSDGRGLRGACALLLPRRALDWVLRNPPPHLAPGSDQALSLALAGSPWDRRGILEPSLFEHVGEVSAQGHRGGQRASWWAGTRR